MDLGQQLSLLLGDFSHLSTRIRHLSYNTDVCGERIEVRCSYLSFRQGEPTVDEFIDVLAEHIIAFCLPRSEIQVAQNAIASGDMIKATRTMVAMSDKAKSLFIKAKKGSFRSGEAGEIVLYIFTEWLLQAPQIVSKMYLKTNSNMPVHGTDGIHAKFNTIDNQLLLYWGESKAHKSLDSALKSALSSIKEFVDDNHEKREIDIISAFADFSLMDVKSKGALLTYLDPYAEESLERITVFSCLLIYEHKPTTDGLTDKEIEQNFVADINDSTATFISTIKDTVKSSNLDLKRFEFFLLPVPSVQDFRDKFQSKIGWPKDD